MRTAINKNIPPLSLGAGSAALIGEQIASVYAEYDANPPAVVDVWCACAEAIGLHDGVRLFKAGYELATALDMGKGTGIENGYHNTKHYIQVLLNVTHLILRNDARNDGLAFFTHEKGMLAFAALAHDFYYQLGGNKTESGDPVPYKLERQSFLAAKPYLEKYEVPLDWIDNIEIIIYGTDVSPASKAGAFVRAANRYWFEGATKPEITPVLIPVADILTNRSLARIAAILNDADILSSAGLTSEYSIAQSIKLGAELGTAVGPQNTIGFLTFVAENRFTSMAASFFQDNMDKIRQTAKKNLVANITYAKQPIRPLSPNQEPQKLKS
jgi:hypothetical protein